MRLTLAKDIGAERAAAEARIDRHFAARAEMLVGPLAALHARKATLARAGADTALIADEADRAAIIHRADEQDTALASLDADRRALKAQIHTAATPAALTELLSTLT